MKNKLRTVLSKKLLIFLGLSIFFTSQIYSQQKTVKPQDSESIFEEVYRVLQAKPKWLSTKEDCPWEIMSKTESDVGYLHEGCQKNARVCLDKCKNNDGNACYSLALLVQIKKGLDQYEAEFLFSRACSLGVSSGCTNRAARIFNDKKNDEKAVECATKTFEKTCARDDAWGCTMFGMSLAGGFGVEKDMEKALKILAKPCQISDEGDPACQSAKQIIEAINKSKDIY
ncbi:MAG: hypothetical protein LUM44_13630 [Pyrinomonadaceae bacterium]|nr:hypothetical protein [Pyrinomonadaceae bacterium]